LKIVHKRIEEGKIAIRNERRDALERLKAQEKNKEISQDEHNSSNQLQKLTDSYTVNMNKSAKIKKKRSWLSSRQTLRFTERARMNLTAENILPLPVHIAIVPDGTGDGRERGLPRLSGHREGVLNMMRMIQYISNTHQILSLLQFFALRIGTARTDTRLVKLCRTFLMSSSIKSRENIRIRHIGRLNGLPSVCKSDSTRSNFNSQ